MRISPRAHRCAILLLLASWSSGAWAQESQLAAREGKPPRAAGHDVAARSNQHHRGIPKNCFAQRRRRAVIRSNKRLDPMVIHPRQGPA